MPDEAIAEYTVYQAFSESGVRPVPSREVNRLATSEVLLQYIEAMSGLRRTDKAKMHPTLAWRVESYVGNPQEHRTPGAVDSAKSLARNMGFQDLVLTTLLPPELRNAYWQTPHGGAVLAEGREAAKRAHAERPEVKALARRLAAEAHPKVDRTVFGIALGALLALPACDPWRSACRGWSGLTVAPKVWVAPRAA